MKKVLFKTIGWGLNTLSFVHPTYMQRIGFNLFCTPFSAKLKSYQTDFLLQAESIDFEFENKKVKGYKWGNGNTKVLLMHGWSSNTFRWKKLIEKMKSEDFSIYAFDAPAHGLSEGKLVNVVKYQHCLNLFIKKTGPINSVVAHSIGGFTVLYALYKNKNFPINKAVIMGAPGEAEDFFNFYKSNLSLSKRTVDLIIKKFEKEIGEKPSYFSSQKFASTIEKPMLLIHDKDDRDTSYKYTENLSKILKNNELIITEGLGHNLKSEKINEKIIEFIKV